MPVAKQLKSYLDQKQIEYEVIDHPVTYSASESAQAAHIPGDQLLKSVVIHCDDGYLLSVVPSTHRVELGSLQDLVEKRLGLATEQEVGELFTDCELGAIPALGAPYGLPVICEDTLAQWGDVFFEGGDHKSLIHLEAASFKQLMANARMAHFSHHV